MTRTTRIRRPATAAAAAVCAIALLPATAAQAGDNTGTEFHVTLSGSQIPGGGDPQGTGLAMLNLDSENNEVCWEINWQGLAGQVTAIHVHKGPAGGTGPHAVDLLDGASLDGGSGSADSCTTPHNHASAEAAKPGGGGHSIFNAHTEPGAGNVLDEIIADPDDYYVNLHTTAYDKGAIRGQLG